MSDMNRALALSAFVIISFSSLNDAGAQTTGNRDATRRMGSAGTVSASGSKYQHRVIPAPSGTWGYEILLNGKAYIRQTTVAGRPGLKGYADKAAAETAAIAEIARIETEGAGSQKAAPAIPTGIR